MMFILHQEALDGEEVLLTLLDRLMDRIADEVHRVEVPAADTLQGSRWYKTARSTRRKVLTTAVSTPPRKRGNPSGLHTKRVEIRNVDDATLANKLSHTPLVVLVEDREADGTLLEIFIEELGHRELKEFWQRATKVTPRAIEIDTAGGIGAMSQRVKRAVADARHEGRPVRHFVFCDSDRRWPGDNDNQSARDVQNVCKVCKEHGIPYHVLAKRCAENYIPDAVFKAVRDDPKNTSHVDRFDALLCLTPTQRDHFPVREGLKPAERQVAIQAGLYDKSDLAHLHLLEDRLFAKRPRPMLRLSDERRRAFTASSLRARDGNGEIDKLLDAIAREL